MHQAEYSMDIAAHLHALCGAKVSMNLPFEWREVRYPNLSRTAIQRHASSRERPIPDDFLASTIMPEDALLATILVCDGGATFVDVHQEPGLVYMARPDFNMRGIVPDKSVLHAFVYNDKCGKRLMGLFDANKIGGEDVSEQPPLVRHGKVFQLYHEAAATAQVPLHILHHGVYYEQACIEIDLAALHFSSSSVFRLPVSASDMACDHFMLPVV